MRQITTYHLQHASGPWIRVQAGSPAYKCSTPFCRNRAKWETFLHSKTHHQYVYLCQRHLVRLDLKNYDDDYLLCNCGIPGCRLVPGAAS